MNVSPSFKLPSFNLNVKSFLSKWASPLLALGALGLFASARRQHRLTQLEQKRQHQQKRILRYQSTQFATKRLEILTFIIQQEWNQFSVFKLKDIHAQFLKYSIDQEQGEISKNRFFEMCINIGWTDVVVTNKLFTFWASGRATLGFLSLVENLNIVCNGTKTEQLERFFDVYDLDGNGFISSEELAHLIGAFMPGTSPDAIASIVSQCMSNAAEQDHTQLTFQEFVTLAEDPNMRIGSKHGLQLQFLQLFGLSEFDVQERNW